MIDLNSDLGESFGAYTLGMDGDVMKSVTSANVACGFHAGDPEVMLKTVKLAAEAGVAVGAHPGHPDLQGFGRRTMACSSEETYAYCLYQIGAMASVCRAAGVRLQHVKAHGALYNQAAKDLALAKAIAKATKDAADGLILLGLANSLFEQAAREEGVPFASEAFADRGYQSDGTLVPRSKPGAMIDDLNIAAARVVRMATEGVVEAVDGAIVHMRPDSVCLHGDSAHAVAMAAAVRDALTRANIAVRPLAEVLKK